MFILFILTARRADTQVLAFTASYCLRHRANNRVATAEEIRVRACSDCVCRSRMELSQPHVCFLLLLFFLNFFFCALCRSQAVMQGPSAIKKLQKQQEAEARLLRQMDAEMARRA